MADKDAQAAGSEGELDRLDRLFLELGERCTDRNIHALVRAVHLLTEQVYQVRVQLDLQNHDAAEWQKDLLHHVELISNARKDKA